MHLNAINFTLGVPEVIPHVVLALTFANHTKTIYASHFPHRLLCSFGRVLQLVERSRGSTVVNVV